MILCRELYDPVERTAEMPVEAFLKYVDICNKQDGPTDLELVDEIRKQFYENHAHRNDKERVDWLWDFVGALVKKNAGLAQFVLDYSAAQSDFFFPWLVAVNTSPSEALEMSYGWGKNIRGNWHYAKYDRIFDFVENDPTFVFNRERQLTVANLVTTAREMRPYGSHLKVVDLGAGRMAWARYHGFLFYPFVQEIIAYDTDETIVPQELFKDTISKRCVFYKHADIATALSDPRCADAGVIILQGVASYLPIHLFCDKMMQPIYHLLRKDGVFFFDLQLDCPYYQRSMKIFDWPEMTLMKSASEAIDAVEAMRKLAWGTGAKFSAEYALDTYNEHPTSLMITLTKIS